ncbi:MAG: type I restriction enzyme HsdR N-terminal domain-containing protein [Bacteroidota bacterium]
MVLQPEELVRQLFIAYLIEEKKYSKSLIAVEKKIGTTQVNRYDILVFDKNHVPFLAVECKAPYVDIQPAPPVEQLLDELGNIHTEIYLPLKAEAQLSHYNRIIQAPYLASTNGRSTYCWKVSQADRRFEFIKSIP